MHPSPGDEQPYIDYFGCPVRFGQPVNRLAFPLHLLMQPLRQPDDALLQMMERQASALLPSCGRRTISNSRCAKPSRAC